MVNRMVEEWRIRQNEAWALKESVHSFVHRTLLKFYGGKGSERGAYEEGALITVICLFFKLPSKR